MSVEDALYSDPRVAEAAGVGIPHPRLGEQVAAVVSVRPENRGQLTEEGLIALAQKRFGSLFMSHLSFDCLCSQIAQICRAGDGFNFGSAIW